VVGSHSDGASQSCVSVLVVPVSIFSLPGAIWWGFLSDLASFLGPSSVICLDLAVYLRAAAHAPTRPQSQLNANPEAKMGATSNELILCSQLTRFCVAL
jgi:hypothetical protein